jgi:FAD/FMN-containing dehydrogenase
VYGGNLYFPIAMAREVLKVYREWIKTLPEDWTTGIALMHIPPLPFLPEPLQGQSVCVVRGCYVGDMADGAAALQPMRELGGLIFDAFGPMSFSDVAMISNDPLAPTNAQAFTEVLSDLSPEVIEMLIAATGRASESPVVFAEVRHVGGAINRTPADSGAFGHRDREFILFVLAVVGNPAEERAIAEYMRQANALFQPHRTGQIYLNFLHDTDTTVARVRASFPPQTYARLVAIKDSYDPANMFRFNRNIPPSSAARGSMNRA